MLDSIRKGQRWLTAFFITVIGLVFVFFMGQGGPPPPGSQNAADVVVQLDQVTLDLRDFQRARTQQTEQLQSALGDQFDPDSAGPFLDAQTLRGMVDRLVLANSAKEVGLVVSQDEIKEVLRRDPALRDAEGKFDADSFNAQIRWEYGSQAVFLEVMERQLLQQKMVDLLYGQVAVSEAEARSAARYRLEQVQIAYVALDGENLPEDAQATEEEVLAYLAAHEEELRAEYDAKLESYGTPEQVHIRHILFVLDLTADQATQDEVLARAEAARERLTAGGEDFEALAIELSEDSASKESGGDLGFIVRGDADPKLEEAAFALEEGAVSEIVTTRAGLHILRVEEKQAEGTRSFDEVGPELADVAANAAKAKEYAVTIAAAIREGASVEEAARERGLTLDRTALFRRRRDGFVPGLGASQELTATAFALTLEKPSSPEIFQVGQRQVLIQLLDRDEPDDAALAEATESSREQLLAQRRGLILQGWIDQRREALLEESRLVVNAAAVGGPAGAF